MEKVCATPECTHGEASHYGSDKRQCNAEGCSCYEFRDAAPAAEGAPVEKPTKKAVEESQALGEDEMESAKASEEAVKGKTKKGKTKVKASLRRGV
jgi:hypothetical protein